MLAMGTTLMRKEIGRGRRERPSEVGRRAGGGLGKSKFGMVREMIGKGGRTGITTCFQRYSGSEFGEEDLGNSGEAGRRNSVVESRSSAGNRHGMGKVEAGIRQWTKDGRGWPECEVVG